MQSSLAPAARENKMFGSAVSLPPARGLQLFNSWNAQPKCFKIMLQHSAGSSKTGRASPSEADGPSPLGDVTDNCSKRDMTQCDNQATGACQPHSLLARLSSSLTSQSSKDSSLNSTSRAGQTSFLTDSRDGDCEASLTRNNRYIMGNMDA